MNTKIRKICLILAELHSHIVSNMTLNLFDFLLCQDIFTYKTQITCLLQDFI